MNKAYFFIANIFVNSVLAFFTAALLIEVILLVFRIKQGRMAALLRMIPIVKLPLDLCLYDFSRWSYLHGVNPLHCAEGTRMLSVLFGRTFSVIEFTVGNMTFTIADVIGYLMNPTHLKLFSISFVLLSCAFFVRKLATYYSSIQKLHSVAIHSEKDVMQGQYRIRISSALHGSPFVAGFVSPIIYIPYHLNECLSKKEYEAVLAHELAHIRHKDILIRCILDVITSLFWWIPTKWLRNRIEEGQEIGCDQSCRNHGIDSIDLAAAIYKAGKRTQNNPDHIFARNLTHHKTLKRIRMLLAPYPNRFRKTKAMFTCLALGIAIVSILFGRFWMF